MVKPTVDGSRNPASTSWCSRYTRKTSSDYSNSRVFCCIPSGCLGFLPPTICRYNFSFTVFFRWMKPPLPALLASTPTHPDFPNRRTTPFCAHGIQLGPSLGTARQFEYFGCCWRVPYIFICVRTQHGTSKLPEIEKLPTKPAIGCCGYRFPCQWFWFPFPLVWHLILVGLAGLSQWRGPRFTTSPCQLKPRSTHKIPRRLISNNNNNNNNHRCQEHAVQPFNLSAGDLIVPKFWDIHKRETPKHKLKFCHPNNLLAYHQA